VVEDPAHVEEDLPHVDAAGDELGAGRLDVEDGELQSLDRPHSSALVAAP
jgi:hypothetical protein